MKTMSLRSGMGAAVRMRLSSEASVLSVIRFASRAMTRALCLTAASASERGMASEEPRALETPGDEDDELALGDGRGGAYEAFERGERVERYPVRLPRDDARPLPDGRLA